VTLRETSETVQGRARHVLMNPVIAKMLRFQPRYSHSCQTTRVVTKLHSCYHITLGAHCTPHVCIWNIHARCASMELGETFLTTDWKEKEMFQKNLQRTLTKDFLRFQSFQNLNRVPTIQSSNLLFTTACAAS